MKLEDERISVHHIGGRNASQPLPVLDKFQKDIINVLYDADPDCIVQIQEKIGNRECELHVLPYCFAESCKSTTFNITYNKFASSLLELNPEYGSYYETALSYRVYDDVLSESFKTMEKIQVETVTLDSIFAVEDAPLQPPDFLSIDAQGAEYEILGGGGNTLRRNVLALALEVEFHPVYKGQKLFGDLCEFLSARGFHFVKFLSLSEVAPFRAPLGARGAGFHLWGDALFLRRIENICDDPYVDRKSLMLEKLAFISIIFNQFEYGLQSLQRARSTSSGQAMPVNQSDQPLYLSFLLDLEKAVEKMPVVLPRTFASIFPFEDSKARFESSSTSAGGRPRVYGDPLTAQPWIKKNLRRIPVLFNLLAWLKRLPVKMTRTLKLPSIKRSAVEAVLIKYGLNKQAELLRRKRILQSHI